MINEWLDKLVIAMAHMEGYGIPGVTPTLNNNPLDLRYAGQANVVNVPVNTAHPAPIAKFTSKQGGICAGYRDLLAKIATGMTLRQLIYVFAPPNENNSKVYLEFVAKETGISPDKKLIELFEL